MAFDCILSKLNYNNRKLCFEIYGFDFMVDAFGKVWLIEVNTNPSITESGSYLKLLVPRMINDAFKLSLDLAFPLSKHQQEKINAEFELPEYNHGENIWVTYEDYKS
jgi:Tubulin-tyrosine ligase family